MPLVVLRLCNQLLELLSQVLRFLLSLTIAAIVNGYALVGVVLRRNHILLTPLFKQAGILLYWKVRVILI